MLGIEGGFYKRAGHPFETAELNNRENSRWAVDLESVICRQYFFKLSYCCGWGVMGNSLCSALEPANKVQSVLHDRPASNVVLVIFA